MIKRLPSITELPLNDVFVPEDRLRPISEAKVAALMQVIEEGVFLGAITVRRESRINMLVDGAHRLEAMRRLGRETIRADVLDCNASEARRLEITGNITAGMTPVQDAIFLGVYQAEYEKLHPETRRGVAGALAKNGLQAKNSSFAEDGLQRKNSSFAEVVAEARQITPRQVRAIIAAGRALSRGERNALQAAGHRIAISEVEKLGKIVDQPLRARAVEALIEGKKVADAVRAAKAEASGEAATEKDPVEDAFNALKRAWERAPMVARRRFFHEFSDDIAAMEGHGE